MRKINERIYWIKCYSFLGDDCNADEKAKGTK